MDIGCHPSPGRRALCLALCLKSRITLPTGIPRTQGWGLALHASDHTFVCVCLSNLAEASPPEVLRAETIVGAALLDTASYSNLFMPLKDPPDSASQLGLFPAFCIGLGHTCRFPMLLDCLV